MKGVILAGGTGSRLYPISKVVNKHLLPIGNKPMIQHSIEKLTAAGIDDIYVVSGVEHIGAVAQFLGSGKEFNCSITLKAQDTAGGIAQALGLLEKCITGSMCVLLGDNIFEDALTPFVQDYAALYARLDHSAMVILKEVAQPSRYGVAVFEHRTLSYIEEKPTKPKSNYAVTGIYFYPGNTVFSYIKNLAFSDRNELEITDVNNAYAKQHNLHYAYLPGWWTDAGTLSSYAYANRLMEKTTL